MMHIIAYIGVIMYFAFISKTLPQFLFVVEGTVSPAERCDFMKSRQC